MKKEIGIIGLGKMGMGVALHAKERGWSVVGYNRSNDKVLEFTASGGGVGADSLTNLVKNLASPRVVWSMVPAGEASEEVFFGNGGLASLLHKDDIIIDAANAQYEDTVRRRKQFDLLGIHFIDVGYSGGPYGARNGGCLMVGGDRATVDTIAPLLSDLALPQGWLYCGESGSGHFVKMVHNGIEYGMMQSLAEGFAVLKEAPFPLNLTDIAKIYNTGSVIESRLVGWLESGLKEYGEELESISGTVAHTGEGKWTIETAKKLAVPVPSIELAYQFRVDSEKNPSYIGKILSTLRNQFGGHSTK